MKFFKLFLVFIIITQSCKNVTKEKAEVLEINNLPFGNEDLIKYNYDTLDWFDEMHFGKAILGYSKLKEIKTEIKGLKLEIQDANKSFYLPNHNTIDYLETNQVNSACKILYTTDNYKLCYLTTTGKDVSEKVFKPESEETNRGYLATINSDNKLLSASEVSNTTEYFTQSYEGKYLGAMYIQNTKTFYIDKQLNIFIYNFIVKVHDLNSEYKLINAEKYTLDDKGSFVKD